MSIRGDSNGLENSEDRRSAGGHGNQHVRLRVAQITSPRICRLQAICCEPAGRPPRTSEISSPAYLICPALSFGNAQNLDGFPSSVGISGCHILRHPAGLGLPRDIARWIAHSLRLVIDLFLVIGFILGQRCSRFPLANGSRIVDAIWCCHVSDGDRVFVDAPRGSRVCGRHRHRASVRFHDRHRCRQCRRTRIPEPDHGTIFQEQRQLPGDQPNSSWNSYRSPISGSRWEAPLRRMTSLASLVSPIAANSRGRGFRSICATGFWIGIWIRSV